MSNYSLDNYVDVPTRLKLALEKWPDLRVQETGREIIDLAGRPFLVCQVTVWRTPDDPIPSIASAAEPAIGLTPYTKNSELMVGFTSALGRALGYMGIGLNSSIASRNEVEARQTAPESPRNPDQPRRAPLGSAAGKPPSEKQINMIRALGHSGPMPETIQAASDLITTLKAAKAQLDTRRKESEAELDAMRAQEEEPF